MSETITDKDVTVLRQQSHATLAYWWCELNRWNWPVALPDPQPQGEMRPTKRRMELMDWIADVVGMKACLREWNRERMTDEEFDAWWKGKERALA